VRTCTNVTSGRPLAGDTILKARRSTLGLNKPDGLLREVFLMPGMRGILAWLATAVFLCAPAAHGQDQPSLGDVARQARLQKQQKDADANNKDVPAKNTPLKDAPAKDVQPKDVVTKDGQTAKAPKTVITNDEIPQHIGPTRTLSNSQTPGEIPQQNPGSGPPAEYWKIQIQTQKDNITSLQSQIASLSDSIQYAGGNCVSNCVQWNEHQQQKQQQLEAMKSQLEEQQKRLEDLQDMARKQGFGSSVYDP
jgi:hypothetical protein